MVRKIFLQDYTVLKKKPTYKRTHTVQTGAIQGSTVLGKRKGREEERETVKKMCKTEMDIWCPLLLYCCYLILTG